MTTIRTTCPRCGEVDMGPESILLSMSDPDGEGVYSFECPGCLEDVQKQADRKIVALLVSAGVAVAAGGPESRGGSLPEAAPPLPPIGFDDLIQFHFLLQDEANLERFLAER